MLNKPAVTTEKLDNIIQNRWSPRAFSEQALSAATITALLEAAQWAPSCMNEQPWRFIVCHKADQPEAWQNLLTCLVEKNQQWAQHAPLLVLAVAANNFTQNGKPNAWAAYDTGAASLSLSLQATALGLVSHQMGGFVAEQCRSRFNLPADTTPLAVIALGYQADPEQLSEEFKSRELAERSRAALAERFYWGGWELQKP